MAFDEEDWRARVRKAKTGEEIRALIMELPDGPSMPEDDLEYSFMEPIVAPDLASPGKTQKPQEAL